MVIFVQNFCYFQVFLGFQVLWQLCIILNKSFTKLFTALCFKTVKLSKTVNNVLNKFKLLHIFLIDLLLKFLFS